MSFHVDFCLIIEYKTHSQDTINLMRHYLEKFHQLNNVFSGFHLEKRDKSTIVKLLAKSHC